MSETIVSQKPQSMTSFFIIFAGQGFSLFGSQLVQFALVWWLTMTTSGSASVLAFASIMALLPQIFLSPLVGPLIDRWNRRIVMIVADGVIALAVVVLAVLYALDAVQLWHIYTLMFIRSTGGAFHWPAMQASTTLMVPEQHLSRVGGLNQSLQGLVNIIAPPVGALLLVVMPMQNILAIDVGTAILAIASLFFVSIPQPQRTQTSKKVQSSVLADLREALRHLWGWKGGLYLLIGSMASNLLIIPAISLMPILIVDHFGGGALEFAWLTSTFGVGMVLGGLVLGVWGGFKRRIVTGMVSVILAGMGMTVVGLAPATAFLLAVGALFFAGLMLSIGNGSMMAILQATVPPEMQGRVFTLMMSGSGAMMPLGLAIAGPVSEVLGVQIWFVIGGIGMAAIGTIAFFVPAVMQIEKRAGARCDGPGGN